LSASASHLRPRTVTELIDAGIQLARAHYGPLAVLSAIVALPGLVINIINSQLLPAAQPASEVAGSFLRILPLTLVGVCLTAIGFGALIASASAAYLTGQALEPGTALRLALGRAGRLVGAKLLAYAIMGGGFIVTGVALAVLLPAILAGGGQNVGLGVVAALAMLGGVVGALVWLAIALPRYANVTPAVMLEDAGVLQALRRSRELSRGSARRILGLLALLFGIGFVLTIMVGEVVAAVFDNRTLANAIGGFVVVPLYPPAAAVLTLLYYDLRIRREGYDIEMMAAGLGDLPAAAPPSGAAPAGEVGTGQPSF
jgi:hypothetical protein